MGAEAAKGIVDTEEDEGEVVATPVPAWEVEEDGRRLYFDFLLLEPPVPPPPPLRGELSPPPKPPNEEVALVVGAAVLPLPLPIPPMGPGVGN